MKTVKLSRLSALIGAVLIAIISIACGRETGQNNAGNNAAARPDSSGKLRIGFSMDTLKEERWQRDPDLFIKRAEELGAEVIVQSADGNDDTQRRQAESF